MPVTMRYSASLDQTYEDHGGDVAGAMPDPPSATPSPAPSDSAGSDPRHLLCSPTPGGSGSGNSDAGSIEPASRHDSRMTYHDRTSSLDSLNDGSLSSGCSGSGGGGGNHSRQLSSESTEFIPTRTVKSTVKPAFNPMQFVKTGASQLGRKAEAQIKRYEEVKKVKELVKEEEEEWQSNLDNWKSKRRHFSKKTVTRAEEIKLLNEEEQERNRIRRNKTFNEMMEERSKRATSSSILPVWNDDDDTGNDNDDVADDKDPGNNNNNNSCKSDVSFESTGSDHVFHEDEDDNHQPHGNGHGNFKSNGTGHDSDTDKSVEEHQQHVQAAPAKAPVNGHGKLGNGTAPASAAAQPPSTDGNQEYTFDKAIQSYTQYAEARNKPKMTDTTKSIVVSSDRPKSLASPRTNQETENDHEHAVNGRHNGSAARGGESPLPNVDADSAKAQIVVHRDEGEEMMILVCLKRGSESKDFGFTTKSVSGAGTGPFVEAVTAASPADEAGLRMGDEILAINGEICTVKRTHSAIVFAIKQAVYTGRLELSVYRYKNPELALLKTTSLASSSSFRGGDSFVECRGQKFSSANGSHEPISTCNREQSPKVDVVKRRSLFESSATRSSPDRAAQNRRSLDVSSKFKDRLASFESLDAGSGGESDSRRTPERDSSFKEKLASFKSLDSLETRPRQWRNSLENLIDQPESRIVTEHVIVDSPKRTRTVLESGQSFEQRQQSFERTQSCEFLGADEDVVEEPEVHRDDDVTVTAELVSLTTASTDQLYHPDDELESNGITEETNFDSGVADERVDYDDGDFLLETDVRDATVTSYDSAGDHRYDVHQPRQLTYDSPPGKSAFELADSLEETAFVGSLPSSPKTTASGEPLMTDYGNLEDVFEEHHSLDAPSFAASTPTSALSSLSPVGEINLEKLLSVDVDLSVSDEVVLVEDFEMPVMSLPPPSEKPPPPPVDPEAGVLEPTTTTKNVNLRRVESTKRIRKEISKRRSDFLGIDGDEVQNYIDNEISNVSPPPKMDEFLKADRELSEQCRQDLLRSEQDRRKTMEIDLQIIHRDKQSSISSSLNLSNDDCYSEENFGVNSLNSSDIASIEREIITNLEWEEEEERRKEQERQRQKHESGNKVEAAEVAPPPSPTKVKSDQSEEALKLREREEELRRQEEKLQLEKKKLREEQESLLKIKEAYQKQIEEHNQRSQVAPNDQPEHQVVSSPPQQQQQPANHRLQNQNVHQSQPSLVLSSSPVQESRPRLAPPTASKPRIASPSSTKVDMNGHDNDSYAVSHSQSASFSDDCHPATQRSPSTATSPVSPPVVPANKKQALYALSASPKAKLLDGDEWMAARREAEAKTTQPSGNSQQRRDNYNQHWVVQEAEFRRLHAPNRDARPANPPPSPTVNRDSSPSNRPPPPTSNHQRDPPGVASSNYDTPTNLNLSNAPAGTLYGHQPPHYNRPQQHQRPPPPNKPLPPIPTGHQGTTPSPQRVSAKPSQANVTTTARYPVGLPHHPQGALPAPPLPTHYQQQQQPIYQSPQPHQHQVAAGPVGGQHQSPYGLNNGDARVNSAPGTAFGPPTPKSNGHSFDKETQMLSVSGKKKCSHCGEELGRGAAMIIESLQLFYHINCFKCCVCHTQLGNGSSGADVRVRSQKLHCHNCYSNDEGLKFSKV